MRGGTIRIRGAIIRIRFFFHRQSFIHSIISITETLDFRERTNDKLSEKLVVEKGTVVKSQKVLILLTTTTTTTVGRIDTVKAKSYDTTLYCWQKQPVCTAFFRFTFVSFRSLLCSTVLISHSTFSERRRTIRNIYIYSTCKYISMKIFGLL